LFNPGNGEDIVLRPGFKVSVFATGLNFPTGIAFRGNSQGFEVYVLESEHGLPSPCNDQSAVGAGDFNPTNPFTPDIRIPCQDIVLSQNVFDSGGGVHTSGYSLWVPKTRRSHQPAGWCTL
jgi:hypothetical protein